MLSCWAIRILVIKLMFIGNMRKMDSFTKLLLNVRTIPIKCLLVRFEISMAY